MTTQPDWINPFKAEDFKVLPAGQAEPFLYQQQAADRANFRFQELSAGAPTVFHYEKGNSHTTGWREKWYKYDTHSAKLLDIKELK